MKGNELQKRILEILKKVSVENSLNNKEVNNLIAELQKNSNLINNNSQVEEQLLTSELNLKSLINNKDESIWSIDSNYNYIIFNDYFKKQYYTTYKIKLEVGINALDILTDNLYDFWKEKYDIALSGKKNVFEFEAKIGKALRCFKVSLNPITSNKKTTGVSALSVDITEQKRIFAKLKASEELQHLITKSSADVIFRMRQSGELIYFSESLEKVFGYKPKEIIGNNFSKFILNSEVKNVTTKLQSAFLDKEIINFTTKILHKDGHIVNVEINGNFIKTNGVLIGQGSIRDITKRKEDELKVRQSEENYKNILQLAPNAFFQSDSKGVIINCNEAAVKLTGYKYKELLGMDIRKLFSNSTLSESPLEYELLKNNETVCTDWELIKKNGKSIIVEMTSKKMSDGTFQSFMMDITERKKIIKSLRESKAKYQLVAEKASDVVWLMDLNGKNIFVTPSIEKFTGFTQEEYLEQTLSKMLTKKSAQVAKSSFTKEVVKYKTRKNRKELSKKIILEYKCKDGSIKIGEVLVTPYYNEKGDLDGIHGVTRDITARIKSDTALQESEELFRNLTQSTSSAVFVYQDDKFVFVNKSTEILSGYTEKELLGMNFWNTVHPDSIEFLKQQVLDRQKGKKVESRYEIKLIKKDKSVAWIDFTGGSINWEGKKAGIGSAFNITKSKTIEKELFENEERYRAISDSTSDYLFSAVIDEKGNNIMDWVGGSFEKITGYKFKEFLDVGGWIALLHSDDTEVDREAYRVLKENRKIEIEVRIFNKKRETRWVRVSAKPIWSEKEKRVVLIHGAVKDITEEKYQELVREIEYNIAQSVVEVSSEEELFRSIKKELIKLVDASNFFVALYNKETDSLKAVIENDEDSVSEWKAEKSITGMVIEKKKKLFLKRDEILALKRSKKIKIIGNIPEVWLGIPLLVRRKAVGAFVVQSYNNPNAYDKLSRELLVAIATQLSLFIEANRAKEVVRLFSKAIIQSPISVMITNSDGIVEYVNTSFEKVTGYNFDDIVGKNPRILKSDNHQEEFYKKLWDSISKGNKWQGEILNKKKDGTLFWEDVIIAPIINAKGTITHFVSHREDISEKKKILNETIEAKNKAEKSEKIKADFLAQISHEIRTPLNNILGTVGALKYELNDLQSQNVNDSFLIIDRAGRRLTRTVDLIINSADLQLEQYISNLTEINVVDILGQIRTEYSKLAENRCLDFRFSLEFKKKAIFSDENAVVQIISNLISNAIKFTDIGYVKLSAKEGSNKELIVTIKDTGVGVSKDFIPKLFDYYTQEEQGYTRSYDGNGLGLFLAKKYCDIIEAEISVKSKKGRGTIFTVKIPNLKLRK